MLLFDVNILLSAYRQDHPAYARVRPWFEAQTGGPTAFGMSPLALSGFLRIVTHPRAFDPPEPMADALVFAEALRAMPNHVVIEPGQEHWKIFAKLCADSGVKGTLVPDAWFAALAIESGCQWITLDRDFARFEGLDWAEPPKGP